MEDEREFDIDGEKEEHSVFSGRSPFMYHDGMQVLRERTSEHPANAAYVVKCVAIKRIDGLDLKMLGELYRYRWLNRRMIEVRLNISSRAAKNRLNTLCSHGFVNRYYFTYSDVNGEQCKGVPFYGVSVGVWEYYSRSAPNGAFIMPDAVTALKELALNQFITYSDLYWDMMVSRKAGFELNINNYTYRFGYCCSFKMADRNISFVPLAVRRNPGHVNDTLNYIKLLFGSIKKFPDGLVPVVICEDSVHMAEVCREVSRDERLSPLLLYYTFDLSVPGNALYSSLYRRISEDDDGAPVFAETELKFE